MSDTQTMVRTQIAIDDSSFLLAQGQDIDELQRRIEAACEAGGRFVSFVVLGNRRVSALLTPHSRVLFSVETVQYDPRDTGDAAGPFGGFFDD
jgi:hypothetical protein